MACLLMSQVLYTLENIEYCLGKCVVRGLFPANLEILFPVLGPRPAIVIDITLACPCELARPAIDISEIAQTFDVGISPGRIVQGRRAIEPHIEMQRRDEGIGIIKYRLVIEPDEDAVVVKRACRSQSSPACR